MQIQTALPKDADILARIIRLANIPVARHLGLDRENAPSHPSLCTPAWILRGMDRGETYYLTRTRGEAVGCAAYDSPDPETAYLNRLAVLPENQGQGLGKALVAHVAGVAKAHGNSTLGIGVIRSHTRLCLWYEGLGFEVTGVKKFDHLPFEVLFMGLDLAEFSGF